MPESNPAAPGRAVFLSYAREDAEAARRVADALRAFGIEVWFDLSELRGGDTWDQKIRRQIRECTLFIPLVSDATQARGEGYFRREWKLGVERSHDIAAGVAFMVPVVIDDTSESHALVPDEFMRFQWTRLRHGVPSPEFVAQIKRLLDSPRRAAAPAPRVVPGAAHATKGGLPGWAWGALGAAAVAIGAAWYFRRPAETPLPPAAAVPAPTAPTPAPTAAPPSEKSIAVLPFASFSTDKDNEFFADGLQDEVITALAKIHDLKVISRTSVTAYANPEGRNLKKIASELGVATILEGSVQRMGTKVHLNVQLIDARNDQHLWAESYTEDVTDVFAIEAALAQKVSDALQANLTSGERDLIARRPTQNGEAYDLYLQARVLYQNSSSLSRAAHFERILELYRRAAAKDPKFALPHIEESKVNGEMYWFGGVDPTEKRKAMAAAELGIAKGLAPDAPETRVAEGAFSYTCLNDWNAALRSFKSAEDALPNDADLIFRTGLAYRRLGQLVEADRQFRHAADLDPHDLFTAQTVVETLYCLRRYPQAVEVGARFVEMFPGSDVIPYYVVRSQFEIDGDRASYLRNYAPIGVRYGGAEFAERAKFNKALVAGDYAAAAGFLADPSVKGVVNIDGSVKEPITLDRAFVAYLQGHADEARAFADEAIASFRGQTWTPRQAPMVKMGIARCEAYAGRADEAIADARAALEESVAQDSFSSLSVRDELGQILVVCGRRDEALEVLTKMFELPMIATGPQTVRINPIWSRLKDDPRFEQIVSSAKPL